MEFKVGRAPFPIIAIVGAGIFVWAPGFVAKASFYLPVSFDFTVADMLRGTLPNSLWFWATVLGFVTVLTIGFTPSVSAQVLAYTGGALILAFPAWSLWKIITDSGDLEDAAISPGWGLFTTVLVGVIVVYLGSKIEEEL